MQAALPSAEVRTDELGPLARHLRELLGLSLREVADELAVSISALSQAERGAPRMVQLALRAVNVHLARAAEDGLIEPGEVRDVLLAQGGATTVLDLIREPEVALRAALLRQSLLARGIEMRMDGSSAIVTFPDVTVSVALGPMLVFALPHMLMGNRSSANRARLGAGGYIVPDPTSEKGGPEDWARAIDRFASALAEAGAQEPFDGRRVHRALKRRA